MNSNSKLPIEVSFIIPAYNEERFIENTIRAVQQSIGECNIEAEIIVVDNDSTDKTAELASSLGARVIPEKIRQIARARNIGAQNAKSEWLIFIDADTQLNVPLLKRTLELFRSKKYVGGGTLIKLNESNQALQRFTNTWNFISRKLNFAAGCYMFCLKSAYASVGGFNENVYASEEIWFMKNLKREGKKLGLKLKIIEDAPIVTSARKLEWFSPSMLILQLSLFFFFPFLCRYKMFCFMWYTRPIKRS